MKKWVFLLIFIFCFSSVIAISEDLPSGWLNRTSGIGNYPQIDIASLKYEPYPVEPGEYFTLWLKVKNLGNDKADNVIVELIEKEPFAIDDDTKQIIGSLGSRQEAVLKFERIRVSEDAIEGDNILEVKTTAGGGYSQNFKHIKLDIRVQSVSPILDISVESEPEMIPQGGTAIITLRLKNIAESLLEDISIKLNLPDELITVGSTTEKKIDRIKSNGEDKIEFDVLALSDATAKAYKVGMNITYYDEIGNRYNKDDYIGLLVGSSPEFYIDVGGSEVYSRGQVGKVMFDIYNTGPSDIKFVTIELIPTKDYDLISNPVIYLGNIDSDDYESGEFKVFVNKCFLCKDEIQFKILMEYRDSYNNKKEEVSYVTFRLYSSNEAKRFGFKTENGKLPSIISYLLMAVFIYLAYKQYRKEKNLPKALKHAFMRMLTYFVRFVRKLRWKYLKRLPRKIRLFLNSLR